MYYIRQYLICLVLKKYERTCSHKGYQRCPTLSTTQILDFECFSDSLWTRSCPRSTQNLSKAVRPHPTAAQMSLERCSPTVQMMFRSVHRPSKAIPPSHLRPSRSCPETAHRFQSRVFKLLKKPRRRRSPNTKI